MNKFLQMYPIYEKAKCRNKSNKKINKKTLYWLAPGENPEQFKTTKTALSTWGQAKQMSE